MPTLTIALKDLRLLLRDPRSAVILVIMPLVVTLILGLTLGRVFTDKPDSKIRISVVVEDEGLGDEPRAFPDRPWSEILLDDLADTANIRVERIPSREQAARLVEIGRPRRCASTVSRVSGAIGTPKSWSGPDDGRTLPPDSSSRR